MSYLPELVALYEIIPYIEYLPLKDKSIRVAVKNYLEGGELKAVIITKYGKICDWNTSEVTDMSKLFCGNIIFNEDISKWNTSQVTNMSKLFWGIYNFNQDISKWDVSKVTNMYGMFAGAENFNQDISKWDVSKVTNMSYMFANAESFNQDIREWDTSKLKFAEYMFEYSISFNPKNASCSLLKIILCINYESYSDSDEYDSDDE